MLYRFGNAVINPTVIQMYKAKHPNSGLLGILFFVGGKPSSLHLSRGNKDHQKLHDWLMSEAIDPNKKRD